MKVCSTCKESKPIGEFNRWSKAKDGLKPYCRSCASSANKKLYENPDYKQQVISRVQEWRGKHPGCREQEYLASRDHRIAKVLEWQKANPEKVRSYKKNSKHKRRTATLTGHVSVTEWLQLCAENNQTCLRCKEVKPLTMDHVIPLSKGGLHSIENIQPLCGSCNSIKHTKSTDYRK